MDRNLLFSKQDKFTHLAGCFTKFVVARNCQLLLPTANLKKASNFTGLYLVLALAIFICGCHPRGQEKKSFYNLPLTESATDSASTVPGALNLGEAVNLDSSIFILFPVELPDNPRQARDMADPSSFADHTQYSSSWYGSYCSKGYRNIIFYNKQTKKYHFLKKENMLIGCFDYFTKQRCGAGKNILLFKIFDFDLNNNKKIDRNDMASLYVSDDSGENLVQVSPTGEEVLSWKVIKETRTLLIRIRKDTDKNREINDKDPANFIEVDLANPGIGKPVFSQKFLDELK